MRANSEYTILVVDDDDSGRYVVARVLRAAGYQVLEAATGGEALKLAARRPDLVVLDVNLPDINGFEVCRRLKELPEEEAPAVLHLSAIYVGDAAMVEGLEGGADGYLTQPVESEVLLAHVKALLRMRTAEQRLAAERDFTDAILDTVGAAVVVLEPGGQFVRANPVALAWSGYTADELSAPGMIEQIIPPDELPGVRGVFESLAQGGPPDEHLDHWVSKTGERRLIQWTNSAIRDTGGQAQFVLGVGIDVTAREQALEDLARSDSRFRTLFDQAGVGVSEIDSRSGRFLSVNRRYCDIVGYSAEELDKISCDSITHPEDCAVQRRNVQSLLEGAIREFSMEKRHLRKDGGIVWVQLTVSPMWRPGEEPHSHICVVEDITQRKQAEEALRQAQKIEAVGQLAGGVAHDFNNLLTVINGYGDMILQRLREGDPLRRQMTEIRRAGERAADLTRQLLAFSRKQIIQPKPVSLNDLITEARSMIERLLGEDIEVTTELQSSGRVMADPGQFHQVLMNLAVNARDAMPGGGALSFETLDVDLDEGCAATHPEVKPGPYALLAVSDTGIGMDEQTRTRIFEPFFTTKETGKGTGLGLATVYGIVRQAGGWIWVYSEPGRGTTFKIYLPRIEAAVEGKEKSEVAPETLRGSETILVVEDQDEVRKLAAEALKSYGYRVLETATGGEALLIAEKHPGPIHLLLTDVVMPRMTGRELAERMKGVRPRILVLYMSGYTQNVIAHRGVLDTDGNYIPKPFAPQSLAVKVRTILGPPAPRASVLVADDDPGIRSLFEQVLKGAGYEVALAEDGWQALSMARERDFDLVITDLLMPAIEGLPVLRQERPELKILAVSGAFEGDFIQSAASLGASATLSKPVSPSALLEQVRKLIE